jgi:4-amino-4-deoxy-L-arabinose transferase-like glycosyltransferase
MNATRTAAEPTKPSLQPGGRPGAVPARWIAGGLAVVLLGAALRFVYPTADPPWRATVGIVWHDEGAWVHNARNKALFGAWRQDEWNPMFIAPVFTGLEYLAFAAFGTGLRQARLVSQAMGLVSVVLLGLGAARLGGRRAGLMAALLLATNYVYVMWNRAALMEATMTSFIVASWYAATRTAASPRWGLAAGLLAVAAYFTKAAAAFYVAALALVATWPLAASAWRHLRGRGGQATGVRAGSVGRLARALWSDPTTRGPILMLSGLAVGGLIALAAFVAPNWQEYWFYNWQMSVTRKPSYTLRAFADRASWLPIVHDFFTRMYLVTVVATIALVGWLARWREAALAERLLVAWVGLGVLELVVHDVGNERRLVFLVPALVAAAALALGRDGRLLPPALASWPRRRALAALPVVLLGAYVVCGALLRLVSLYEVRPGVRAAAAAAVALVAAVYATWPASVRFVSGAIAPRATAVLVGLAAAGDLAQFAQWAAGRTYKNYAASRRVAERLAPGTLVHGKLANGLALESRIRPVFVGRGFGNYADRLNRDDIQYLLTYVSPRIGYEGSVILDILDAYPQHRILWTVDVAESPGGADRAALILKGPRLARTAATGPSPARAGPSVAAEDAAGRPAGPASAPSLQAGRPDRAQPADRREEP